jgi:hypothetical protein
VKYIYFGDFNPPKHILTCFIIRNQDGKMPVLICILLASVCIAPQNNQHCRSKVGYTVFSRELRQKGTLISQSTIQLHERMSGIRYIFIPPGLGPVRKRRHD